MHQTSKFALRPLLGTAMWGWTTSESVCFDLLDHFYEQGLREVDTATNYPIDKDPEHFRLAERILQRWIAAHGVTDLQVMVKVGSVNNLMTPDHELSESFLRMNLDRYQKEFGSNLNCLMLHWDNRSDRAEIEGSYRALLAAREAGLQIGLSGLKHPEIHVGVCEELGLNPRIQLKHNLLQSAISHYRPFHRRADFIAYGINGGGIKLDGHYSENSSLAARGRADEADLLKQRLLKLREQANRNPDRPPLQSFNHFGLLNVAREPLIGSVLLGVSKVTQLQDSLDFLAAAAAFSYDDVLVREV